MDLQVIDAPRRPVAELADLIGVTRTARMLGEAAEFRKRLGTRVIWNLSSTATGGGVAEMLLALVGYTKDLGIDIRWRVIRADADFFRITKRVHNRIHGSAGDGGELGEAEHAHVDEVLRANAESLTEINEGDLVLLHDPQTAGLARYLAGRGARVVWRCHIGTDEPTEVARSGWEFLRSYLDGPEAFVFTRRSYAPDYLTPNRVWVIPPSIDPFSPKNQYLDDDVVTATLREMGVVAGATEVVTQAARYTRRDGSPGLVSQPASVAAEELPGPDDPIVVQVSRWDRLKDMVGVMRGFADRVVPSVPAWLVLAGPSVEGVTDDPEGAVVFGECLAQWQELPAKARARVVLATLPMADVDDNAAMVNALQRRAKVITQKSLAEGFGLTVAEGMWKGRPVVASDVGGISDQVSADTGILIRDPADLDTFGDEVRRLLEDPQLAERLGRNAHDHIRDRYVGDLHLLRYAELFSTMLPGAVLPGT